MSHHADGQYDHGADHARPQSSTPPGATPPGGTPVQGTPPGGMPVHGTTKPDGFTPPGGTAVPPPPVPPRPVPSPPPPAASPPHPAVPPRPAAPGPAAPGAPPRPVPPPGPPDRSPAWGSGGYPLPPLRPVPPLPPPPEQPNGVLWAILPFLTFGVATPVTFLYAAVKRGSWNYGAAAAGYGIGLVTMLAALNSGNVLLIALGTILLLTLWPAGTAHAFAVRRQVYPREVPRSHNNESAVEYAKYRRNLRADARAIVAEDPALAHELRIGRPDVPRAYDDGGLVDANHAPAEIIAALPGMTEELAERVVAHRDEHGTFVSVEEMAVDCDLPPAIMPQLAEYTIFLP